MGARDFYRLDGFLGSSDRLGHQPRWLYFGRDLKRPLGFLEGSQGIRQVLDC